jgi:outer membrane receptor protein involved in Fe transport
VLATSYRQDSYFNAGLLPGYARLDLGTFYDFLIGDRQKVRFSVNIQNAFDRVYYLASNGQNQVRPGPPISVMSSLRWSWQ